MAWLCHSAQIITLAVFIVTSSGQQNNHPSNPCPEIFQYKFNGNEWYGVVEIPDLHLQYKHSIELIVTLYLRVSTTQNNIGSIKLFDDLGGGRRIVDKLPMKYRIQFPYRYPLPMVTKIIYNGKLLCESHAKLLDVTSPISYIQLKHVLNTNFNHDNHFTNNYENNNKNDKFYNRASMDNHTTENIIDICGRQEQQLSPLIYGGRKIQRGDWPWLVAVYLNRPRGLKFNCGGSVISTKAIITAAHCLQSTTRTYQTHEIIVWLGRHSLLNWNEEGSVSSNIEEIIIHPDFKKHSEESFDADLGILIIAKRITYTKYIRPICLSNDYLNIGAQNNGTVVGWGRDNTDTILSNSPKIIELPMIDDVECVNRSIALLNVVSKRTFCAGTLDSSGPCQGDSGSGLMIITKMGWILKGIVSAGLTDPNTGHCRLTDYVVFTDVQKFIPWIKNFI